MMAGKLAQMKKTQVKAVEATTAPEVDDTQKKGGPEKKDRTKKLSTYVLSLIHI